MAEVQLMLARYLRSAARQRFTWGVHDCGLFIADWVQERTGADPAHALRGRYDDEEGAARVAGPLGVAGAVRRCARAAGLTPTREPIAGDVAIVSDARRVMMGAIRCRTGWAMRHQEAGLIVCGADNVRMIAAWRVA